MPWIESLLVSAATAALLLLVLVNAAFFAGLLLTKQRGFVDRWTKPLVVASTVLLLTAVGAPVAGFAAKMAGRVVTTITSAPPAFIAGK
jgi:steroid 5-alpha reductase family enzyme